MEVQRALRHRAHPGTTRRLLQGPVHRIERMRRTGQGGDPQQLAGRRRLRTGGRRAEGLAPTDRSITLTEDHEDMLADQVYKVVAVSNSATPDGLLAAARQAVGDLASVTRSSEGRALVELGPLGMTKATALARHAASRGIEAKDVIAFGDMPNDVEMLAWAGRGYAMTGAHPEAVAAAGYTAPSAAEDGVAQVVERMLALQVALS